MKDDDFLESWMPLETFFRALETRYRSERLRTNGKPYPEGAETDKLQNALYSACELYIDATKVQREIMRDLFKWSYLLPTYLLRIIKFPKKDVSPDSAVHSARVALAAASLEDNKTDFRDMFMALGGLYLGITAHGINPEPFFQEAASWSSDTRGTGPNGQPMKYFLSNFKSTEFFRSSVEPRLSGA